MEKKELELYIHIPFCVKKCDYCDFLSFSADEQTQRSYVAALQKELVFYGAKYKGRRITTIFIGGGTPSWLREESMQAVMETVYQNFAVDGDADIASNSGCEGAAWLSSARAVRCRLKCHNERNPYH